MPDGPLGLDSNLPGPAPLITGARRTVDTAMKMTLRVLVFVALMAVYLAFAGAPGWQTLLGRKLTVIYGAGAVLALWVGGQPIGTLQPVSLRPIFITVGVILMLGVFILMLSTKDVVKSSAGGPHHALHRSAEAVA